MNVTVLLHLLFCVQQAVITKKQETYNTQTKQIDDALVYDGGTR
jgi:hypothetical protein